ncbi:class I SAM-dependent methyltransferase [Coxiella endosymbiont of Dermacentor marginatus]|uniref:class I SAM-dependent methyltransferase n=1 Tax=Coxiella endosymbiont of Dermacentor marginatus TaxID=1656159 RepID=UPI002221BD4A|nr:class I SAM-dependent methyltransferase [Coxiella endosymbiont of Dermacentor marginatus]
MTNITVTCLDESRQQYAEKLAAELKLTLVSPPTTENYRILLAVTPTRLELRLTDPRAPGPVYVDFLKGALHRRLTGGVIKGQLISRAIGLKGHSNRTVLDLTAGLGRDAFILANLGCKITMLERNSIIAALLKEGLARARTTANWFNSLQLKLIEIEAQSYLSTLKTSYDVIYIDPMYPIRKKSALVKKEMRVLRQVVGKDEDAPQLLERALEKVRHRVVVKRPRLAPKLTDAHPSLSYEGKSSRFDVYLTC